MREGHGGQQKRQQSSLSDKPFMVLKISPELIKDQDTQMLIGKNLQSLPNVYYNIRTILVFEKDHKEINIVFHFRPLCDNIQRQMMTSSKFYLPHLGLALGQDNCKMIVF